MKAPRANRGNRSPRRYTGGRPKVWRDVRLRVSEAAVIEETLGTSIDTVLQRIAAMAKSDPDGVRATLAPFISTFPVE